MSNCIMAGEIKQLSTKQIFVDPLYQRQLRSAKVSKIAKEWDPNIANPLKVSSRDGKYWLFDGQHTMAAAIIRNGNQPAIMTCRVYYGMTFKDEAEYFVRQNGTQTALQANDEFRALFNIGDPDVCGMVRAAEKHGCKVDFKTGKAAKKCIAVKKLYEIYMHTTKAQYGDVLDIIMEAWDGESDGYNAHILGGLATFLRTYDGEYKKKLLTKKLHKESPAKILRDGGAAYGQGDRKYARVILDVYNRGTSTDRLENKL
jgi:hypothetical protein